MPKAMASIRGPKSTSNTTASSISTARFNGKYLFVKTPHLRLTGRDPVYAALSWPSWAPSYHGRTDPPVGTLL